MGKLGSILLAHNKISVEQLQEALILQTKTPKKKLCEILIELNYITEEDIYTALAEQNNMEFIHISEIKNISESALSAIPLDVAFQYKILPVALKDDTLTVAITDPKLDMYKIKPLLKFRNIIPVLTTLSEMDKCLRSYYTVIIQAEENPSDLLVEKEQEIVKEEEVKVAAEEEAPAIKMVNRLLELAVNNEASDIHLEPFDKHMFVRFRIDGVLQDKLTIPKRMQNAIISRIKIMSALDIAEHRLPQDGRIKIKVGEKKVDLRVSTLPTVYGEKVVMRILDVSALCVELDKLGIELISLEIYKEKIKIPYGLILVTGPTASGKTTTLYSTLSVLNKRDVNIITVEDPVEYLLPGINQVQTYSDIGLTFANVLRAILRQDPNIIMVGEIRDKETADIVINAALTGHLVLSTLHTNDSFTAITRLHNMGIEPFLISSVLLVVVAQRLVRKLCKECHREYMVPCEELIRMGTPADWLPKNEDKIKVFQPAGCDLCANTGYRGRIGCYEILDIGDEIKEGIIQRLSANELKKIGYSTNIGMYSLRRSALKKW